MALFAIVWLQNILMWMRLRGSSDVFQPFFVTLCIVWIVWWLGEYGHLQHAVSSPAGFIVYMAERAIALRDAQDLMYSRSCVCALYAFVVGSVSFQFCIW